MANTAKRSADISEDDSAIVGVNVRAIGTEQVSNTANAKVTQIVGDVGTPVILKKEIASATITYIGSALPGTATSSANWQIIRLTYNAGGDLTDIQFEDGNANYDNDWDGRAAGSYS